MYGRVFHSCCFSLHFCWSSLLLAQKLRLAGFYSFSSWKYLGGKRRGENRDLKMDYIRGTTSGRTILDAKSAKKWREMCYCFFFFLFSQFFYSFLLFRLFVRIQDGYILQKDVSMFFALTDNITIGSFCITRTKKYCELRYCTWVFFGISSTKLLKLNSIFHHIQENCGGNRSAHWGNSSFFVVVWKEGTFFSKQRIITC